MSSRSNPLRWSTLAVWSALFVGSVLACLGVAFSTDYTIFFAEDDPERVAFTEMEERFTQTDNFVFVVKPAHGDVFTGRTLDAVARLSERAEAIPYARRVDSLVNHPRASSTMDDLLVAPLVQDATQLSPDALAEIRAHALAEPLLAGGLVAEDGSATGVVVTLDLPREDPMEVREATTAARAMVETLRVEEPELEVRLSGLAAMNDAFMGVSIDDLLSVVPVMYMGMFLLLFVLLRSVGATLAIGAVVTVSCAAAMSVAGLAGFPLTPPSASAPTVVMTLAIADCVHVFVAARHARASGLAKDDAIVAALRETWRPVVLTSLTTMAGFLALNFAESTPFWHLGNMAAVGIAVALLASLTLFPALLGFVKIPPLAESDGGFASQVFGFVGRLAQRALARPALALGVGLALTVVGGVAMTRLVSNEQFVEYFDEGVEFREDTEFLVENLTGIYGLEYVLDSGAPDDIVDPAYLGHVDDFATWLRAQPEVRHVHAFSDVLRSVSEGFTGDRALPESREASAQTLLLYEMSLPAGRDLRDRVDAERRRTRLSATVGNLSTVELRDLETRSEAWLRANTPESMHTEATSPVMIFSKLTARNTHAMLRGNLATLVVISLFLLLVLRRRRLAIVSLLPNLAPMVGAYGLWALVRQEIGIVAAIAGSVCLGIVVDDTIHLLSRYERYRDRGESVEDALHHTLATVGPALVVTSLVLALGFGALTFSSFQMNVHLGALTSLVIFLALLADLFFLPSLVLVVERFGARSPQPKARSMSFSLRPAKRLFSFLQGLFAVALVFGASPAHAQSPEQRGAAIARRVAQTASGYGDFEAALSMQMEGGTPRALRLRALETEGGVHSLILFDGPADVRGTALLSRQEEGDAQQWLYLPAMRRSRRIAGGQLSAAFLGSEFAYEDISGIAPSRYTWRATGQASCVEGSSDVCDQVESRPRFEGSGYAKRIVYVDRDHARVRRIEYFGADGQRLKTLVHADWRQHQGRFWRAHRWTMTNHRTHRSTVIEVGEYSFGNGYSDRDFTERSLGRVR